MKDQEWECTDSDSGQYGRKISDRIWEYKQTDINDGKPLVIDLDRYTNEQIEDCIQAYGYTTMSDGGYETTQGGQYSKNIYQLYDKDADQIICECLFEMEEKPNKWL